MDITEEEIQTDSAVIGRPHIANAMLKKGYVSSTNDAFRFYIGDGKPCYAPGVRFSIDETISAIHKAGGKAVLAHPILLKKRTLIKKVLSFPFDGVECYYANFSRSQNEEIRQIVNRIGNYVHTGGSDYHGDIKPYLQLGSAYTTFENLEILSCKS
jgi:predicted metal-dependent phosphoesterase TrpH